MKSKLHQSASKDEQNRGEQYQSPRFFYINTSLHKKKILGNIVLVLALILMSLPNKTFAEYGNPVFITYKNHLDEIKQKIKEKDEKPEKYLQKNELRKDYDGDGIKDISIKSDKNIYFVSSIE